MIEACNSGKSGTQYGTDKNEAGNYLPILASESGTGGVRLVFVSLAFSVLAIGGCITPSIYEATAKFIIVDASTGKELDNCLMVRDFRRSDADIGVLGGYTHSSGHPKLVDVSIERIDSGYVLHQKAVDEVWVPLGIFYVTRDSHYGYSVFRQGYLSEHLQGNQLAQSVRGEGSLTVKLVPAVPGTEDFQRNVGVNGLRLESWSPFIRPGEEEWAALLALMEGQCQRVLEITKPGPRLSLARYSREEAEKALKRIAKLRSRRDAKGKRDGNKQKGAMVTDEE